MPAGQIAQNEAEEDALYLPGGHDAHALLPFSAYVPAGQGVQRNAPRVLIVPASHERHATLDVHAEQAKLLLAKVPAGQVTQNAARAVLYMPAAQLEQDDAPPSLNVPAAHARQAAMDVLPTLGL